MHISHPSAIPLQIFVENIKELEELLKELEELGSIGKEFPVLESLYRYFKSKGYYDCLENLERLCIM